jgi:3-dehydroquinate synthase
VEATRISLVQPQGATRLVVASEPDGWLAEELAPWVAGRRVFVVTSERPWQLHGAALEDALGAAAAHRVLSVPDGEEAKSLAQAERLWRGLSAEGGKRDSRVVAFGGGSVGDLAGFVAGCFLRGIAVCQVPTTVIAQVDAAVGGKTAVNLPEAKNAVGVFHHPELVLADPRWLATLGTRELRSGLAEVVKMAVLFDLALLERVEETLDALERGEPEVWGPVVAAAQAIKAGVVGRDPTESGERELLNFGHTLGHALEAGLGFGRLLHGEAVLYGMLFALRLAEAEGAEVAPRLRRLLAALAPPALPDVDPDIVWSHLGRDKKGREGMQRWVLVARPGVGRIAALPAAEVRPGLEAFLARPWGSC